jgi:betaine-aldehyde dehydrogenase
VGRADREDVRRSQLIAATIDTMAEVGFAATTLALIGQQAGISPGLVAHYFRDKDGLLEATLRSLAARLTRATAVNLAAATTPLGRIKAVIDSYLAVEQFDRRTSTVWLAFWGEALHSPRLKRIESAYQRRMLSNLRHGLKPLVGPRAAVPLAISIAAMIDGLWLRATLSGGSEIDSIAARAMVERFVAEQISLAREQPKILEASVVQQGAVPRHRNYIDGAYRSAEGGAVFTTDNPATGAVLAEIEIAASPEIDRAVLAAKRGQAAWSALPGSERGRVLRRIADLLRARNDDLALLETLDTGKPIQETSAVDVISGADCFDYFAGLAGSIAGEHIDFDPQSFGYTRREPLGIVAGIGAWNYPLQIACWKSAPALACGNAMIFKPSELTPLTALKLAEIMTEAGLPDGVFNVVQGFAATGSALARHPEIRKISLTGSVGTGRKVMADSADSLKYVTLELGGKSPLIIFDDANLDDAVSGALLANFYSAGEVCSNGTRVFVHEAVKEQFIAKLTERVHRMVIGDPQDPATQVGSLISQSHMEKVLGHIRAAELDGAKLLVGGQRAMAGALSQGFFVEPTVFEVEDEQLAIAREEIFGPVMSLLSFADEEDVVRRANATEFGLSAGVFTCDLARAHRVIAQLEAGTCWINHYNVTPIALPFGGAKRSGLGRENGRAAIEHYTQLKSVYVNLGPILSPY